MPLINRLAARTGGWLKRPLACVGLSLLCAQVVLATDPLYQNTANSYYTIPGNPWPIIDATNFDNESVFSVTYNTYSSMTSVPFETRNTVNYLNGDNGLMTFNSPSLTNGFLIATYGITATFDTFNYAANKNSMAGSFNNTGTIRVDSILDGNNVFNFAGFQFYFLTSLGQCNISATNIACPGNIVVGADGQIKMTGESVDLSRGVLNMESLFNSSQGVIGSTLLNNVNFNSIGTVGTDTNADWNPGQDLTATTALSSYSPYPNIINLTNSTSYFDVKGIGTSNVIYRSVFVQNSSPNAPYNVYFDAPNAGSIGFGLGAAHVEWVGSTVDPASGTTQTSYLYLTDDYKLGASTNVVVIGGVPDNFSFVSSSSRLLSNPTPAGFTNVFTTAYITNPFAYMNGQILPNSVSTNVSPTNPRGTLTNLPSRILITASKELNLDHATISGQNYLALTATNQFDGSAGANIISPYADLNLGVTNGFMTISNLLVANIPNWSGTLQCWSTRWVEVDATTGVTNDFRVLLVASALQPTSVPYVQNLKLHATTNLVISDVLNVYASLFIDSQQLTLTTNEFGNGATSLDGELNWVGSGNVGPVQLPNLRWLTNNGAIRTSNLLLLTNANNNYGAVINNGLIADQGTTIYATNFLSSGTISNGVGNFTANTLTTTLTNGGLYAGGNISLTANTLLMSNLTLVAGTSLTLQVTNSLTDGVTNGVTGLTNANFWSVQNPTGTGGSGLSLLQKPLTGDLLGTTISNYAAGPARLVSSLWAGQDRGRSSAGFTNNAAIGQLVLDAVGNFSQFKFSGTRTNNAIYVDCLVFNDYMTNGINSSYDFSQNLFINTNMVVYFAQAYANGISIAEKIDNASKNGRNYGGRLRWVPSYAGYFSSVALVYPDGSTNYFNAALAGSPTIDSNGNGVANKFDPTPFFIASQVNLRITATNSQPPHLAISWNSIPSATNTVLMSTNLTGGWTGLTTFISPATVPPAGGWPITNVLNLVLTNGSAATPHFYRVRLDPNLGY